MTGALDLEAAFLADFASPSNGVLQVVNGGINQLWRGEFPSPLKVYLVCLIRITPGFSGGQAGLSVLVRSTENDDIYARVELHTLFAAMPDDAVSVVAPIVVDLSAVAIPRLGRFAVTVSLGNTQKVVDFEVLPPQAPSQVATAAESK